MPTTATAAVATTGYTLLADGTIAPLIIDKVFWALNTFGARDREIRISVRVDLGINAIRGVDPGREELDSTQFRHVDAPNNTIEGIFRGKTFGKDDRLEIEVKDYHGVPDGIYDILISEIHSLSFVFPVTVSRELRSPHRGNPLDE